MIGDLEVRLRQVTLDLASVESERSGLQDNVGHLTDDIRKLSNVNTGLEKKLETKNNVVSGITEGVFFN